MRVKVISYQQKQHLKQAAFILNSMYEWGAWGISGISDTNITTTETRYFLSNNQLDPKSFTATEIQSRKADILENTLGKGD